MTGIYNFRTHEVINMRSMPFAAKFCVSTLVSVTMCVKLYNKQVYEPELYRIALKYRPQFDSDYQKLQQQEPLF